MIQVRPTSEQDVADVLRIARAEPLFSVQEAQTVEELLNDYLKRPDHNGYLFLTGELDGAFAGFACYGPKPLTSGTYELFWICVARPLAGHGVGRALIARVRDEVSALGGRLIVLDTSGRPDFAPTRAFYERLGFQRTASVPDFYTPGDDLVIYTLRLAEIAAPAVGAQAIFIPETATAPVEPSPLPPVLAGTA